MATNPRATQTSYRNLIAWALVLLAMLDVAMVNGNESRLGEPARISAVSAEILGHQAPLSRCERELPRVTGLISHKVRARIAMSFERIGERIVEFLLRLATILQRWSGYLRHMAAMVELVRGQTATAGE